MVSIFGTQAYILQESDRFVPGAKDSFHYHIKISESGTVYVLHTVDEHLARKKAHYRAVLEAAINQKLLEPTKENLVFCDNGHIAILSAGVLRDILVKRLDIIERNCLHAASELMTKPRTPEMWERYRDLLRQQGEFTPIIIDLNAKIGDS